MLLKRRQLLISLVSIIAAGTAYRFAGFIAAPAQKPLIKATDPLQDETKYIDEDIGVKDYIYKQSNFDQPFPEDIHLQSQRFNLLQQLVNRLARLQNLVGHGNFSLLGYDDMLKYARNYSKVGEFTKQERSFMEEMFFTDASQYGFLGEKVIQSMTAEVTKADVVKLPHTGNYLYKGESLAMYQRLKKDIGDNLILTSGIRSIVKQMYLFLAKTIETKGNLSQASRSLAPPGHSFHAVGDFDVGKVNFGADNFSARFAQTEEYKKLEELGYISIRYTRDNRFGVRYEPWHIKVV